MHCSAKRGIAIACRPSVCPSVRLSVILECDNADKAIMFALLIYDVNKLCTTAEVALFYMLMIYY